MELIKRYTITDKRKYPQIGIPIHWIRQYMTDGDELELYQEGDRLILVAKKKEKASA